ncbi:MAG: hypothetical protein HQ485_11010 [Acidobacteria bacterium]|nr:hypothetical protein [Acidobacteriota bacterium]
MTRRLFSARVAALLAIVVAAGCQSIDLKTAVEVAEVSSGYYDNGLKDGLNHLVPSLTFSLRNTSGQDLSSIDVVVMYWAEGDDAEQDEAIIKAIGGSGLAPGALSEPVVSRSKIGYTLAQPRAELFAHGGFRDWTAKLFVKRGGKIASVGEYKIERRLLLNVSTEPTPR